jgi:hypothetical protein
MLILGTALALAALKPVTSPAGQPRLHKIVLSDSGFEPENLTVEKGDTVEFSTTRKSFFWPASNLHPTHFLYPEFDPKEPIGAQTTWSFRFDRTGTWKFHDHLAPYFTGVITVAENGRANGANNCAKQNSVNCWQDTLAGLVKSKGLVAALDEMARLYKESPEFPGSCHYLAHNIGIASFELYLKDKTSVLTPNAAFCANGFYHGFMEALLTTTGDLAEATAFCDLVRDKVAPQAPDAEFQCYHGIGHGAMDTAIDAHSSEGEEAIVRPALQLCEKAAAGHPEKRYRCASGVFNGIANFYITGEHGLKPRAGDPLWICRVQEDKYKESCYGNMNSYVFWAAKNDLAAALKVIANISDTAYAPKSVEYQAALSVLSLKDPAEGISACATLKGTLHAACIKGLAHGFLEHGTPGIEYKDALGFCRAIPQGLDRTTCFAYVLGNLSGWYPSSTIKSICASVSDAERGVANCPK